MTAGELQIFPARMDCLPRAAAFVDDFCQRHGIARSDALRLTLIVEELFTNTVTHGHGGDSDAPVRIALDRGDRQVTLCYEDDAPPFDPLQRLQAAPPELDAAIEERPVGGQGVHLVTQMAHRVDYSFAEGLNRLRLVLRREG